MKTRWIKKTAETTETQAMKMPWARGARRAAMIERRTEAMNRLNFLTA